MIKETAVLFPQAPYGGSGRSSPESENSCLAVKSGSGPCHRVRNEEVGRKGQIHAEFPR